MVNSMDVIHNLFCQLTAEIDNYSLNIVQKSNVEKQNRVAENSILAVPLNKLSSSSSKHQSSTTDTWKMLSDLSNCLKVHIKNASYYNTFFETVEKYKQTIEQETVKAKSYLGKDIIGVVPEQVFRFSRQLSSLYTKWWRKIDEICLQCNNVVPLTYRQHQADIKLPAVMLVSHKSSNGISFKRKEAVFVTDTNDRLHWKVENMRGESSMVPSVCCLLSGPEPNCIDKVSNLKLYFASKWTVAMREFGSYIISYILPFFNVAGFMSNDYFESVPTETKGEIEKVLTAIEALLDQCIFFRDSFYEELKSRIHRMRVGLKIYDDDDMVDDVTRIEINTIFLLTSPIILHEVHSTKNAEVKSSGLLHDTKKMLVLILDSYREFNKHWETFKSKVDFTHFYKFNNLPVEVTSPKTSSSNDELFEFMTKGVNAILERNASISKITNRDNANPVISSTNYSNTKLYRITKNPKLSAKQLPSDSSFTAGGSLDITDMWWDYECETCGVVNLQIIDEQNVPNNTVTLHGEDKTLPFKQIKIFGVIDVLNMSAVAFEEAIERGILCLETQSFVNSHTLQRIPLLEAIQLGYVKASSPLCDSFDS